MEGVPQQSLLTHCLGFQNFLKDALTIVDVSRNNTMPWLLLATMALGAAATAFAGLLLLSACMKRYDATYSAAMFVGSFVVSASIMSAIHYDTFLHVTGTNLILYLTGLAVIIAGVWVLIMDNDQSRYAKPGECSVDAAEWNDSIEVLETVHTGTNKNLLSDDCIL